MRMNEKRIKIELRKISESDPKKYWLIKSVGNTCEIYMVEDVDKVLPLIAKYLEPSKVA